MLNLRQIEAFRAVMLAGTVTAASHMLNISQPAVSRLIRDLEKDVGLRLFERRKGRVLPTAEAETLYNEVERSFLGLRRIEETAREIRDFGADRLEVGAMPALCLDLVPDVVRSFLSGRPGVKVSVQARSSQRVVELTAGRRFDLGLAGPPFERDGIRSLIEVSAPCVGVLPLGHPLAARTRLEIADLDGHAFIALTAEQMVRQRLDRIFDRTGVRPDVRIEAPLSYVICGMVGHGLGVSVIDPFTAHHLSDSRIVRLPIVPEVRFSFGVLMPAERSLTQLGRVFFEALIEGIERHAATHAADIRIDLRDKTIGARIFRGGTT